MITEVKLWWEKAAENYQQQCRIPIDILYGPGAPNEDELQLIGPVAGKHVLEIGCGGAQAAIAFAKRGAVVTGIDIAEAQLRFARELAAKEGVEITLLQGDMADLGPIATASQDVVFSACAFGYVDDLFACFAEVHRVLKPTGIFVWSVGHPFNQVLDDHHPEALIVINSYFDTGIHIEGATDTPGEAFASFNRTISDYFDLLIQTGFVVERLIEPDSRKRYACDPWYGLWETTPERCAKLPQTIILKCRKDRVVTLQFITGDAPL
ncbi:MAG TPA: class I SAM-dependent methyltransferase [Anaerolineae bacterium]|nr:class I SAM-dependent methyltransferase [Anaerolineae bacterium]